MFERLKDRGTNRSSLEPSETGRASQPVGADMERSDTSPSSASNASVAIPKRGQSFMRAALSKLSLRQRLAILVGLVACALLGVAFGWRHQEQSKTEAMLKSEVDQTRTLLIDINELRARIYENFVNDYSRWDEAVDFVAKPDPEWASANLESAPDSFDLQGLFVFDATGRSVYELPDTIPNRVAEFPIHPSRLRSIFAHKPVVRFFAKDELGLLEVFGATIHRTEDYDRTGQSFGYLFAIKRWDESYLHELKVLTSCEVRCLSLIEWNMEHAHEQPNDEVHVDEIAVGPFGEQVAIIELSRSSPLLAEIERATRSAFTLLALFALFAFFTLVYGLYRFVSRPLDRVSEALQKQSAQPLTPMLDATHEFGILSRLIRDFFDHKHELVGEIERRKASEGELAKACHAAEQISQSKLRFLANVSHEIRTPLNGVLGIVELLRTTKLDPSQSELVDALKGSGDSMLEVLNGVLDLAKLEEGKLVVDAVEFDLGALIEDTVMLFAPQAQSKGIEIGGLLVGDTQALVRGDKSRVRQILMNLTGNAVKFTKQGEVRIEVRFVETKRSTAYYEFTVRDTGIGIPKDKLETIFEAFGQASASDTRLYGGTGLGLTISRHLARVLGGEIRVESEPGKGSAFRVTMPFELSRTEWGSQVECVCSRRVIVCAAQPLTRDVLCAKLESLSTDVLFCDRLEDAQAELAKRDSLPMSPLLVVEYRQSFGPALEVARRMHKLARRQAATAVMIMNLSDATTLRALPPAGLPVIIAKPMRMNTLREIVRDERPVTPNPDDEQSSSWFATESNFHGRRVLIAQSHPPTQRILLDLVSTLGCEATLATDGEAALDAARNGQFDLAIIDLRLARLDGCGLARQVRAHERARGTKRLPMLAMNAAERDREEWRSAGFDGAIDPQRGLDEFAGMVGRSLATARS